jgi:TolB-like protein/tetratricopeptide (TPR) repeat protein
LRFFAELKRRNVIRMGGLYLVGAWLLIQVAETLLPAFDVPGWVLRALILLLALGFIPALVFSWIYELTPEGLKRDGDVDPAQSISAQTARRLDQWTLIALALVVLLIAADRWWPKQADAPQAAVAPAATSSAAQPIPQPSPDAVPPAPEPGERSVAVLPFVNMSNDPEQEYFSDGISEELLNRLAKMPDLQVAARTSAFRFKGQNLDIADIGRQLRVVHVLEGSVRKAGIKLRITAQLIDSRSGYHLWSESYDRDATDVFRVQDEIAGEIARALKAKLGAPSDTAPSAGKAVPEAYDDYLLGRSFVARRLQENLRQAIAAFDRAVARDPQFAAAHSGRAFAQLLLPMWGSGEARLRLHEARTSAARALELDPDHAEALMVRGMAALFSYRAQDARGDLQRALALAPNSADILNMYGDFLTQTGALGEAERIKRAAMLRDPLAMVHPLNLADIMLAQGHPTEALVFAEQAYALGGGPYALDRVVIAQTLLGKPAEAATTTENACALGATDYGGCSFNRALVLAAQGQRDQARALLLQLADGALSSGRAEDEYIVEVLPWFFVQIDDIASATRLQRQCLENACWFATFPLIGNRFGIALPEEVSDDPQWLALWDDPRVADLMTEFRRNVVAWRAEQR